MKNENRYRRYQDDADRYYDSDRYRRYDERYNEFDDSNNDWRGNNSRRYGYESNYPDSPNYIGRSDRFNEYDSNRNWRRNRFGSDYDYDRNYNDRSRNYGNEYQTQNYGLGSRVNRNWRNDNDYDNREDRTWWDKTRDEVSSWFGDDDAERRRRRDEMMDDVNHRGKGPKNYKRSSDRIKEDVNDKLSDNWMLDASDIEVEVKGSEVTLNGTVDSRISKRRAEDAADSVSGVTHVQNNLRVKNAINQNTPSTTATTTNTSGSTYSNGARKKETMNHN